MRKEIYWIDGVWPGKLAVAARPRGGDWLETDIGSWKRSGIDAVLSLLTAAEEVDLELHDERGAVEKSGMKFLVFPIADRQVPRSDAEFGEALEKVNAELSGGRNVLVHCRQGIGRSGLVAASLLVKNGMSPGPAVDVVSAARGLTVPETPEQRQWIDRYAVSLSVLR